MTDASPKVPIVIHQLGYVADDRAALAPESVAPLAPVATATIPMDSGAAISPPNTDGLDAVRGLCLIGLMISALIGGRDVAYGPFLFTVAAALPLALTPRLASGETEIAILGTTIVRYVALLVLALGLGHASALATGEASLSFARYDGVAAGLAFVSITGPVIWYLTRDNLLARIGVLAVVMALVLGATGDGWVRQWWFGSPLALVLDPSRLLLLAVAIPGTIIGDILLHGRADDQPTLSPPIPQRASWSRMRVWALVGLCTATPALAVVGLHTGHVQRATQVVVPLLISGALLTLRPTRSAERTLRSLFRWGAVWLTIGVCSASFDGGLTATSETLPYWATAAGVATLGIVAVTASLAVLSRRTWARPLIVVGRRPLVTYAVSTVLIAALFALTRQ